MSNKISLNSGKSPEEKYINKYNFLQYKFSPFNSYTLSSFFSLVS